MHSVKRKGRRTKSQVGSAQEAYICALPSQERQIEKGIHVYQSTLQCLGFLFKFFFILNELQIRKGMQMLVLLEMLFKWRA